MSQHKHEAATPRPTPAKVPNALLQKFHKQHRQLEEFGNRYVTQAATRIKKKTTAKNPIKIEITMKGPGREIIGMPRRMETTPQEVFRARSVAYFRNAAAASLSARNALKEGHIEDFYDYLLSAERLLGAAEAQLGVDEITSDLASAKARASQRARGTYTRKELVLDYYRKTVDPILSANQAAEKVYDWYVSTTGKYLSVPKLAKYISAEKKKIASSSTAPSLLPLDSPPGRLISPKPLRRS